MRKSPAVAISRVGDRSTELGSNESANFTTELVSFKTCFRFGEHAYDRLGPGRPDEHTPRSLQCLVHALDLLQDRHRQLHRDNRHILFRLRIALQDGHGLAQRSSLDRLTQQERGGQAVTGHVVAQIDDVARLLAAQDASFLAQRLQDVAIADAVS